MRPDFGVKWQNDHSSKQAVHLEVLHHVETHSEFCFPAAYTGLFLPEYFLQRPDLQNGCIHRVLFAPGKVHLQIESRTSYA